MPKAPLKPAKPYAEFPLFPHASGRWAKKIRGHHRSGFDRPSKRLLREARVASGERLYSAADLRAILATTADPLCSMTLLAINTAYGPHDIATLRQREVDLEGGW